MTGPEHYREAERLLRDQYRTERSVTEAQAHATLALAAATALNDHGTEIDGGGMPLDDLNEWRKTVGTNLQKKREAS